MTPCTQIDRSVGPRYSEVYAKKRGGALENPIPPRGAIANTEGPQAKDFGRQALTTAFFAACIAATSIAGAQVGSFADIAGTWLVAADHYDAWSERGIEITAYPMLRIEPDGRFTLYRLRGMCAPDGPGGKPLHPGNLEHDLACAAARERSAKDGLRAVYARVSAAGQVKRDGKSALRFVSEERSPMPSEWAQLLPQLRAAGAFRDEADAKRHETFHSTFYVLDGLPATYQRKGVSLVLDDPKSRRRLEYRLARAEVLDSAMAMSRAFEFLSGDYFRCLVPKLDAAIPMTGTPSAPLGKLALMARELSVRSDATMLVAALAQAGRATTEQSAGLKQAMTQLRKSEDELNAHPLAKAINKDGPAEAFGCPKPQRR